jgi:hypothetical protein
MNDHVVKALCDCSLVLLWMFLIWKQTMEYLRVKRSGDETNRDVEDAIEEGQKLIEKCDDNNTDPTVTKSISLTKTWINIAECYCKMRKVDSKLRAVEQAIWIFIGVGFIIVSLSNCINTIQHLTHKQCPFQTRYECRICDEPVPTNAVPTKVQVEIKDESKVPEK